MQAQSLGLKTYSHSSYQAIAVLGQNKMRKAQSAKGEAPFTPKVKCAS
jgi:hypothetical protein